ncbi:hypothetical protein BHM03_00008416 [Ensete ventricosum]|uniref:Uncharacterized protein n=1 Tax=Ensete ventricosum TaxID=4639 RepID=A0A427AE21_ENSVE|nr:hypothetical protein B296_00004613 [Ensete ventricosum]RZR82073.1 hypothetical protein BHM03_00008416 [Ensete ventricosum]
MRDLDSPEASRKGTSHRDLPLRQGKIKREEEGARIEEKETRENLDNPLSVSQKLRSVTGTRTSISLVEGYRSWIGTLDVPQISFEDQEPKGKRNNLRERKWKSSRRRKGARRQ